MKRRSFFGVMGGAAVAGPEMLKQAAGQFTSGLEAMSLPQTGGGLGGTALGYPTNANVFGAVSEVAQAKEMLGKIIGITAAQRAKAKRDLYVAALDPDIASYRSISLVAKMDMQRERQLQARIDDARSFWERVAAGVFAKDDHVPF